MGGAVLEPPAEKVLEKMNFSVIKRDEVRIMYEQAADKKMQIQIMADLMNCEEADVCDLLGIPHTKKRKHGCINEAEAMEMHRNGATSYAIAKAFDVTESAVKAWKWRVGLMQHSAETRAKYSKFRELYDLGWNDIEIAEETGVNRKTICDWRKMNKLPAHALLHWRDWEECDEIYRPMYEEGMTDSQIAEECGVNPWNVRDWRQKRMLVANRIPGRSGGRKPRKDREHEDALIRPLYERGLSDTQIEKETGITRRAVCEWRHKFNLPVNGRKQK
jgi:predicted transcriptional regulator